MSGKRVVVINPPPKDGCCEVCGKHVSQLKPFGKEGDPLVGNFDGALLIKTFRSMAPEMSEEQMKEYRKKYGDEKADLYEQAMSTVSPSWECRGCIVLSDEEYFKKRR